MDPRESRAPASRSSSRLGYAGPAATGPRPERGLLGPAAVRVPAICAAAFFVLDPGSRSGAQPGARGPRSPPSPPGPPRLPACPWRRAPRLRRPTSSAPCGPPVYADTTTLSPAGPRADAGNAAPRREGDAREPAGAAPGAARRCAARPLPLGAARGAGLSPGPGTKPGAPPEAWGQPARRAPAAAPRAHLPGLFSA